MTEIASPQTDVAAIGRAIVALHKERFGRGPTTTRTYFAGPDIVVCALEDALLPAERELIHNGKEERVRELRTSWQVATEPAFIAAVEQILYRKVRAFASAIDPKGNMIFEVFCLDSREDGARSQPRAPLVT